MNGISNLNQIELIHEINTEKNRIVHKSSLTCKKRTVLFRKSTNPKSALGVVVRFRVYRNKLKKNIAKKKNHFQLPQKETCTQSYSVCKDLSLFNSWLSGVG